jgi:hypothetical protein
MSDKRELLSISRCAHRALEMTDLKKVKSCAERRMRMHRLSPP